MGAQILDSLEGPLREARGVVLSLPAALALGLRGADVEPAEGSQHHDAQHREQAEAPVQHRHDQHVEWDEGHVEQGDEGAPADEAACRREVAQDLAGFLAGLRVGGEAGEELGRHRDRVAGRRPDRETTPHRVGQSPDHQGQDHDQSQINQRRDGPRSEHAVIDLQHVQ